MQEDHGNVRLDLSQANHGSLDVRCDILCAEVAAQDVIAAYQQRGQPGTTPDGHRCLVCRYVPRPRAEPGDIGELGGAESTREVSGPASGHTHIPDAYRHAVTQSDDVDHGFP